MSQPEQHAEEHGAESQAARGVPEGVPGVGEIVAGKYRIESILGVGGMGVVLAAMHIHLGERVALKFLLPSMATAETAERFSREARASARIKSEHIAHVTDVATTESGAAYMVMEFLEGKDLAAALRDGEPLAVRDAVEYVIQACDAVAEAHAMGIVHRDLKPANLFLARRPGAPARIKVLDFGISKITPPEHQSEPTPLYQQRAMTHTRAWLGSPLYMAPEQMKSAKSVDARTDIWALGVILFELLTCTVPFTGSNLPELCAEILHGKPADLEARRPDVPAGLGDVIRLCLAKEPSQRFQNIAELVMALVDYGPRRARSVAERAVSLIEQAGLTRSKSTLPRAALDSTLAGEGLMSPLRESVAPPSSLRLESPSIPRPPRTPSFAPQDQADVSQAATMMARPGELTQAEGSERRGALVPLLVVLTLVASVAGTFLYLRYRAGSGAATQAATSEAAAPSAPSVSATVGAPQASAPAAPRELAAPSAASPDAPAASADATAPASASASPAAAPSAHPSASASAPKLFGRLPGAPSSKPSAGAPVAPPAATSVRANPGGGITVETCRETLPDGSTRPCKQ